MLSVFDFIVAIFPEISMRRHYLTIDKDCCLNVSYSIIKDEKLIFEVYDGHITIDNILSCNNYEMADPNYNQDYNMLSDFRDAEVRLLLPEMPMFIDYFNSLPGGHKRKLALVLNSYNYQVFSTILASNIGKINIDVRLFKSMKQALSWLGKSNYTESIKKMVGEAKKEHQTLK